MQSNFSTILPWVLIHEGGYVNHPKDPGGATNKGVIQRTYNAYRKRMGMLPKNVRNITQPEVDQIYKEQYWDRVRGDDLPSGLDYTVMDFAVNSGPSRAIKYMQRRLGVTADGSIGMHTLGALEGVKDMEALIIGINEDRWAFLKRLKHWGTFGKGWTRRVMGNRIGVQADDHGTIDRSVMLFRGSADIPAPKSVEDGAGAKANGADTSLVASVKDAVADRGAAGIGSTVVTGVGVLSQLEGPLAYGVSAAIVIATLGGLYWLIRRDAVRE